MFSAAFAVFAYTIRPTGGCPPSQAKSTVCSAFNIIAIITVSHLIYSIKIEVDFPVDEQRIHQGLKVLLEMLAADAQHLQHQCL